MPKTHAGLRSRQRTLRRSHAALAGQRVAGRRQATFQKVQYFIVKETFLD